MDDTKHDPAQIYVKEKKKMNTYIVTFHMIGGNKVTIETTDPRNKLDFTDQLCLTTNFALLEEGKMCVNMRNVIYIEVEEKKDE